MDFADRISNERLQPDPFVLLEAFLRVSQTIRLCLNDWLARFELNDGRYSVLKSLESAADGGCSQADLAELLGQSESNVSTLIERMQRDGLVDRLRSEADRRKRVLLISPNGRATLARIDEHRSAWAARILNGIPAADRAVLGTLLKHLSKGLEADREWAFDTVMPITKALGGDEFAARKSTVIESRNDPVDDPRSPQFALQKMLLALSSRSEIESRERDVA